MDEGEQQGRDDQGLSGPQERGAERLAERDRATADRRDEDHTEHTGLAIGDGREGGEQRAEHHHHAEQAGRHVDAIVDRLPPREHGGEPRAREQEPYEGAPDAREDAAPLPQKPQKLARDDAVYGAHAHPPSVSGSGWSVRARKDRKSTRLNSSHVSESRMPSS